MPRTRVYGQDNADELATTVRKQGGRRVQIRKMVGYEGHHDEWFLVTWNRPQPFNVHQNLWWILAVAIAVLLWRING
jgi:hypothetical protein